MIFCPYQNPGPGRFTPGMTARPSATSSPRCVIFTTMIPAKVFARDEPLFLKPCGVGIHAVTGDAVAYGVEGGLEEACIHGVVGVLGKEAQERAPAVFGLKLCKSTFFFHREFSK